MNLKSTIQKITFLLLLFAIGMSHSVMAQETKKKVKKEWEYMSPTGEKMKVDVEYVMKEEVESDGEINTKYDFEYRMKGDEGTKIKREIEVKRKIQEDGEVIVKIEGDIDEEMKGMFERELEYDIKSVTEDGIRTTETEIEREIEVNGKEIIDEETKNTTITRVGGTTSNINTNMGSVSSGSTRPVSSSMSTYSNGGVDSPFGDLPPTSEYGKCFAKCKTPDVYETVTVKQLVKEAEVKYENVPARFETVTERVMIKEGAMKYRTIPATYKTITEQVMVEPEKTTIKTIPAKYRTETRQVLVSEARGEWVKKKKSPNCFSENPEDCYVVCLEEVPAKYRTEKYEVLETAARTESVVIPAKYNTISKRVVDQPARVEEIPVDAEYKTVSKKVMVEPASTRTIEIPAVYKDVQERRLVRKGGYTVWTEILCGAQTTNSKISEVQRMLKSKGYDPGVIDGMMGLRTQTALRQFQQDNGLPIGNMNMETLRALGVN